ncbi:hypothetical protein BGZ99_002377 [Dissophora globulifera]|uniref:BZIP domain-containing protein n=1 Tax=Dissophora globulifera TaxID=979702 RepID=A0A9P6V0I5_9FUNG|nr:hypothetical protein BGZ99_002377 [Dissophora globulifera]
MSTTYNAFSAGAAERLIKSADSLDFALQGVNKKPANAANVSRQSLLDYGSLDSVFGGATDLSASLFDDWLANDLHQVGFMSHDDALYPSSSSSESESGNSPHLGSESDSPVVGFDSIASDGELIQSSGFDASMALFPEVQQQLSAPALPAPTPAPAVATPSPMLSLTPEAVQQAAAALNIPWSKSLETAVLAQSLLASIPMVLQMPLRPSAAPLTPVAAAPSPVPEQAERAVSPAAAATTPSTPNSERALSMPATPRMSLSILSSTQTPVSETSSVRATTYKSAYRSASLSRGSLKRDRDFDEPPSVLEGKDLAEMDEVALKRAKNTDAARRSRHKKLVRMEGLEQRVAELEVENSMFEAKLNDVELERSLLADKDQMQQARIQELEKLLSSVREKLY